MSNSPEITRDRIKSTYGKRARFYDITANFYYLIGVREYKYRKMAVQALELKRGDTVIEIGCGTGLNFHIILKYIGPEGKIIGVDFTEAMLDQARSRVQDNGWKNVELIQCDAAKYKFPERVDGVLSTFAISLIPEVECVILSGSKALRDGSKFVICDMQIPNSWISSITPWLLPLVKPFAVSEDHIEKRPWEIIERTFKDNLKKVTKKDLYLGFLFLIAGHK